MVKKILLLMFSTLVFYGCSNNKSEEDELLEDVLVEVILFEFTPDTGNDSQRLRYEIKFTNPNNRSIIGAYLITTNADGLITGKSPAHGLPCTEIRANSECTISFDEEEPFETGLATIKSIKLVSVEYRIVE